MSRRRRRRRHDQCQCCRRRGTPTVATCPVSRPWAILDGRYVVDTDDPLDDGEGRTDCFVGYDPVLDRSVCIRLPWWPLVSREVYPDQGAAAAARFLAEVRLAARFSPCPHLPTVLDLVVGSPSPQPAYAGRPAVIEELYGANLGTHLVRHGPLTPRLVARVLSQLGCALGALHRGGYVHVGPKPSNLLDGLGDPLVLVDYELARPIGTVFDDASVRWVNLCFAPPAIFDRTPLCPADDVYVAACTAYELLTGVPPLPSNEVLAGSQPIFPIGTLADPASWDQRRRAFAAVVCWEIPVPPSHRRIGLPRSLDAVVLKALAKAPSDRFPSVAAFAGAFGDAVGNAMSRRRRRRRHDRAH